jgi:hypothetical protein
MEKEKAKSFVKEPDLSYWQYTYGCSRRNTIDLHPCLGKVPKFTLNDFQRYGKVFGHLGL